MIKAPLHILAAVGLTIAAAAPGQAQSVSGDARAADGDSLVVAGQRVRLFGIDAPELDQTCDKDGSVWRCGEAAKAQLAELVAGQRIECRGQGADQYGRILAVCSGRYGEINRIMVEQGWATAFRQYSDAYIAEELRAKAARQGLWSSNFAAPSEYRQSKLPPPALRAALRCAGTIAHGNTGPRLAARLKAIAIAAASGSIICRVCPITTRPGLRSCFALRPTPKPPATDGRSFAPERLPGTMGGRDLSAPDGGCISRRGQ